MMERAISFLPRSAHELKLLQYFSDLQDMISVSLRLHSLMPLLQHPVGCWLALMTLLSEGGQESSGLLSCPRVSSTCCYSWL